MFEGLIATGAGLAAFGFPALVANTRPSMFFPLFLAVLSLGSAGIALVAAAHSFYGDGYRAALLAAGVDLEPPPLWGLDIKALWRVGVYFWGYMACVLIYGRFKITKAGT